MNPTNDPLIEITPDELASIARCKRPGRTKDTPPIAVCGRLSFESRLWYVAEFVYQARLSEQGGKLDVAGNWRDRARNIAAELTREATDRWNADEEWDVKDLRAVADAMEGKHLPKKLRTGPQRVFTAVNELCAKNPGRLPYREELIDAGLRGELISEVAPQGKKRGPIKLPRKPGQGRKPPK